MILIREEGTMRSAKTPSRPRGPEVMVVVVVMG